MSFRRIAVALAVASLAGGVAPSIASADVDPVGCTQTLGYDNTIPTLGHVVRRPSGPGRRAPARPRADGRGRRRPVQRRPARRTRTAAT